MAQTIFKFILIGESGTGKSSLITRLIHHSFNPALTQTIGADFYEYPITIENNPVQLVIWDTAGQERYYTVVKSYYRLSLGILLVFDLTHRPSFESIPRWLRDARQEADPNCEVLLVGNKSDLKAERAVTTEEAQNFADEHRVKYIETSALTDENVQQAFLTVANDIYKKTITGQINPLPLKAQEPEKEEKVKTCC